VARYIAFLRAINVGGHVVKMETLRAHFTELGFTDVSTFIASGNVIFEAPVQASRLEKKIEEHLQAALGYEVDTFLRTPDQVRQVIAAAELKLGRFLAKGANVYIGFLRKLPSEAQQKQTVALSNEVDVLSFHNRELFWLCHESMAQTTITPPKLAKALGGPTTTRNITSLRKLIATPLA